MTPGIDLAIRTNAYIVGSTIAINVPKPHLTSDIPSRSYRDTQEYPYRTRGVSNCLYGKTAGIV